MKTVLILGLINPLTVCAAHFSRKDSLALHLVGGGASLHSISQDAVLLLQPSDLTLQLFSDLLELQRESSLVIGCSH